MSEGFNLEEWINTDHSGLSPHEIHNEIIRGTVETLDQFKAVAVDMIDEMINALNSEDIVMADAMGNEFHQRADLIGYILDVANRSIVMRRRLDSTQN